MQIIIYRLTYLTLSINFFLSSDHGENSIILRNEQLGFDAVCTNKEDVCCPIETNPKVTEKCSDDPDYHCVGIQVGKIFCLV